MENLELSMFSTDMLYTSETHSFCFGHHSDKPLRHFRWVIAPVQQLPGHYSMRFELLRVLRMIRWLLLCHLQDKKGCKSLHSLKSKFRKVPISPHTKSRRVLALQMTQFRQKAACEKGQMSKAPKGSSHTSFGTGCLSSVSQHAKQAESIFH